MTLWMLERAASRRPAQVAGLLLLLTFRAVHGVHRIHLHHAVGRQPVGQHAPRRQMQLHRAALLSDIKDLRYHPVRPL